MSIDDLIKKYGYKGISLLIQDFVSRSPEFPGSVELASRLGRVSAELEVALRTYTPSEPAKCRHGNIRGNCFDCEE